MIIQMGDWVNKNISMTEFIYMVKQNFLPEDIKFIVEIGSLDGIDSKLFKKNFPSARVLAIEGDPDNYKTFFNNADNIESWNKVIYSHNGKITYHVKDDRGIRSIYDRGKNYPGPEINLDCYRLDTLINTPIDMLKIDVEGATLEVLKGMGELLNTVKIMHLETETKEFFEEQSLHETVLNFLKDRFKPLSICGTLIDENGIQYDSVWIKI